MAKIKISKNLINSIGSQNNDVYIKKTQTLVRKIVSASVKELSEKISYVTSKNVVLQPVNELLNSAFCDNSQFVYFLGVENAQLELNTAKKTIFWKDLWQRFKFAWANRRKKKHKKNKKDLSSVSSENELIQPKDMTKYSIYDLAKDFQKALSLQLSATSLIYLSGNEISIVGKEDFGSNVKIKIYLVHSNEDVFKFYAGRRKGFVEVNVKERCKTLSEKLNKVGDNLTKILKIFNILYCNSNNKLPNQVFMESILCSVPDELFEGEDIYKVFLKIINYISIKSIKNISSINNPNKTIFSDEICGQEGFGFMKMLDFLSQHDK